MARYAAYTLMGLLIGAGVLITPAAFAQTWYPGDGVEEGLLLKYRLAHFDYKRNQPFEVTIWFGEKDDRDNWIVDVIIVERGEVFTGKMTLSAITLVPLGAVDEELRPYRDAIRTSLMWLESYTNKIRPSSLAVGSEWGATGVIGGGNIIVGPTGKESIIAAGQSWDTTVVGFTFAIESKIWVKEGFPLPIRAKVYTMASQHPIPVEYEYELLETRITPTPPEPPVSELQLPTPPLSTSTTSAIFNVDLYWDPVQIQAGEPTQLGVVIFDQQNRLVSNVRYNLIITDANGDTIMNQVFTARDGQGTHQITFDEVGRTQVQVIVLAELPGVAETIREVANFQLVVVPEFPVSVALIMASIVGMMVAMTRFRSSIMPKL